MRKWTTMLVAALLAAVSAGSMTGCGKNTGGTIAKGDLALDENFACTITVDGGGQWANYNTTSSMEESETNPYPYNTLQTLANEYMALHKNVKIELATTSYNGSRDAILPMLTTASAPDILFQVPTCLVEDCNRGYYAALDEYLEQPNPYSAKGEKGNEKWGDIYDDAELHRAVNGHYYAAAMDRGAMGMVYNKTFFTQNNLTVPTTYTEFLQLIEDIHTIAPDKTPYSANGGNSWLDICLESAVYENVVDEWDVLQKDGIIDGQESVRAYVKGLYDPFGERAQEVARLAAAKTKYMPNPQTVQMRNEFMLGNIIMGEADGSTVSYLSGNVSSFEVGVFPFPDLDTQASSFAKAGAGTRRGSCGLSTAWFITNHAFSSSDADANLKKVNACADFLMFLTAPKNNDRMVNDKKVAVPLSGNGYGKNDCFKPLMEVYAQDCKDANRRAWGAFAPSACLGKTYYDTAYIAYHNYLFGNTDSKAKGNFNTYATVLDNGLDKASDRLVRSNKWDKTKW